MSETNPVPVQPAGARMQQPVRRPVVVKKKTSVLPWVLFVFALVGLGVSLVMNLGLAAALVGGEVGMMEKELVSGSTGGDQRVVVVKLEGVVNQAMADFANDAFDHLTESVPGAVVLRVDSPGGSPTASDEIWRRIEKFQKETGKPVVASFGSVAASGGYYVATGCNEIYAEPLTITGSIGVISQAFTFSGTLDKLGMQPEVLVADDSPRKDVANTAMRAWNEQDRDKVKMLLNHYYDAFFKRVQEGRQGKIADADLPAICNGDVYTAEQAVANKLVDASGYQEDAVAAAAQLAGLPANVTVNELTPPVTFMEALQGKAQAAGVGGQTQWTPETIRWAVQDLSTPRIMYLAPVAPGW